MTPRDGDVVFQTSLSAQSQAIQTATRSRFSHVGIVRGGDVLEAVGPVKLTRWSEWIARGKGKHWVLMRYKGPLNAATLKSAEDRYLGLPYDFAFGWQDDRIYCSELVWKVYKHALGVELVPLQRLGDFDLSSPLVKKKLEERYGASVPLEEPVISPGALASSRLLELVAEE